MASIKFSALISGIKGSLNGSTIQGGRAGSILRNKPLPDQRSFLASAPQKSYFSRLAREWRNLSPADQTDWVNEAPNYQLYNKFGDLYSPSGFQLFCTLNLNRLRNGAVMLSTPLAPKPITTLTKVVAQLNLNVPQFLFNLTTGALQPNTYFNLYATHALSPGIQVSYRHFHFIGSYRSTELPNIDVYSDYLATDPPALPVGEKIFVYARMMRQDTGELGPIVGSDLFVSL